MLLAILFFWTIQKKKPFQIEKLRLGFVFLIDANNVPKQKFVIQVYSSLVETQKKWLKNYAEFR